MSIYRRKGSPHWWVNISVAGRKTRRTTRTDDRGQAKEFEERERARLWRLHHLGDRSAVRFAEAAARWLNETLKRSKSKDDHILTWFAPRLDDAPLSEITVDAIQELREIGLKEGKSPATVDRHMCVLRAVLRKSAKEWGYLDKAPNVPMYAAAVPEPRWLTPKEFDRLFKQLPPHLKLCAKFAVYTGLRMRSQLQLTWDRVDLRARRLWIPGDQMKGARAHGIPLSPTAIKILRKCKSMHPTGARVFQYDGRPLDDCNTRAFQKAVARSGIGPLRWHDLRHTFAAWAIQDGVTLYELMQLGGWKSYSMVMRYAHLAPDHLAAAAAKIGSKRGTKRAQRQNGKHT
jgi:integrase